MLGAKVGTAWIGSFVVAIAAALAGSESAFAAPPANDAFANATALTSSLPASDSGTNREATLEPGEPDHGDVAGGRSVWYRWTPNSAGRVVVDTCDSTFDTQLSVYTGSSVEGLTRVAGNDDSVGCRNRGAVTYLVRAGETYRIAVAGRAGAIGTVRLAIRSSGTPANDHIAAATPLDPPSGAPAGATGSTEGATAEVGEPAHQGAPASRSVWFWWRADAAGVYRIDSCGSTYSSRLAVYSGYAGALTSALGGATDCAGGRRGTITVPRAGTTYLIAVDGVAGATGGFQISLRPPAPTLSVVAGTPVVEGDAGQTDAVFTVTLDRISLDPVSVAFEADAPALVDDGSGPFRDWEPVNGTLRFAPGELVKQVPVKVNGDIRDEDDENALRLEIATPENATILGRSASALIVDDDEPPPAGWDCF